MLKTHRIIPLVFILFFFGFTLITVAPVLAQSTQELESRISALEELLCSLHPEAGTEKYSVCDVAKQSGRVETDSVRQRDRAEAERVRQAEMEAERLAVIEAERVRQAEIAEAERLAVIEAERVRQAEIAEAERVRFKAEMEAERARFKAEMEAEMARVEAEMEAERVRTKNWDKDPYTYSPDGSARQSPDGKFRCVGFPEVLENPNEPKGVAYAKCKQKFGEATGNTAPPPPKKFFCADFPEALNYQECMQKKKKVEECQRNPGMC
jgi:hypothetical protein